MFKSFVKYNYYNTLEPTQNDYMKCYTLIYLFEIYTF